MSNELRRAHYGPFENCLRISDRCTQKHTRCCGARRITAARVAGLAAPRRQTGAQTPAKILLLPVKAGGPRPLAGGCSRGAGSWRPLLGCLVARLSPGAAQLLAQPSLDDPTVHFSRDTNREQG